jgi:hypothetical protein
MVIVFKTALDDGVLPVAEVDESWNWTGNIEWVNMIKMAVLRTNSPTFPTRIEDLPSIFKGKIFWAEVKK